MSESPLPDATQPDAVPRKSSSSQTRFFALLGLMTVMAAALWYDYKVARPAVESAYDRVAQLNAEMNRKSGKRFMTNLDVQKELQRTPIETFTEGGYFVEVYGWRAGLPVKSHKYFAVYTNGPSKMFLKHYLTEIDLRELRSLPLDGRGQETVTDPSQLPPAPSGVPGPRPGRPGPEAAGRSGANDSEVGGPAAADQPSPPGNGEPSKRSDPER